MIEIIIGVACGLVLVAAWWAVWYFVVVPQKQQKMEAEIQKEAEVIKQKKLLEVKEKFLSKKNELDKEIHQRNQQIQISFFRNFWTTFHFFKILLNPRIMIMQQIKKSRKKKTIIRHRLLHFHRRFLPNE